MNNSETEPQDQFADEHDALTHDNDDVRSEEPVTDDEHLDAGHETVEPTQADKRVKTPRKSSGAVAWLALLSGLIAAGIAGYTYWKQDQFHSSYLENIKVEQEKAVAAASSVQDNIQSKLNAQLSALKDDNDSLVDELSTSNRRLERRLSSDVDTLSERLAETESKIVTLRGFSDEAKYAYVKAEVEYFLQTANNRLMLAQDVGSALIALEAADQRLNILRDPSLVRVRAELRDEIQALKAVKQPDITGLALTLASIAKQVPELPMRMHDDEDYFKEEIPLKQCDPEKEECVAWRIGLSNVWRYMRGTVDGLVEVRDATPSDAPMLSVEDEAMLYSMLEIQLQSARLAALKQDTANFDSSVNSAKQILERYFDTEQQSVKAALDSVGSLENTVLSPKLPDISTSLKMLRALQSGLSAESVLPKADSTPQAATSETEPDTTVSPEANADDNTEDSTGN